MSSELSHKLAKVVIGGFALYFLYLFSHVVEVVNKRYTGTEDGNYVNNVRTTPQLQKLAFSLTQDCVDENCKVQNILDYVTNIPYVVNNYTAHLPKDTIENNFGDCDDKSNLLISLLHELHIESYFVLVPKHIFVIVALDNIANKKAIYLNNKPYYVLESTAKNSKIGFPLTYALDEIQAIVEPFENKKLNIDKINYK